MERETCKNRRIMHALKRSDTLNAARQSWSLTNSQHMSPPRHSASPGAARRHPRRRYPLVTFHEFLDLVERAPRVVGVYPETKHPTWHNALPQVRPGKDDCSRLQFTVSLVPYSHRGASQ
jgi:hypothetical protein